MQATLGGEFIARPTLYQRVLLLNQGGDRGGQNREKATDGQFGPQTDEVQTKMI